MSHTLTSETERVLLIKTIPAFADLDTYSARQLAYLIEERVTRRGTFLLEQDVRPRGCHFLPHRRCDVAVDGQVVGQLEGPASAGLWALLGRTKARCSVRARRDMVTLYLPGEIAVQLWESNFALMSESLATAASLVLDHRGGLPFDPASLPEANPGGPINHPLDLTDKLEVHLDNSFYRRANLEAVAEVCRGQSEVRLCAGDQLWQAGDDSGFFYRIVSGTVDILQDASSMGEIGVGYAFGLFESLAQRPRAYDAVASRDLVLLRTEIGHFLDVQHDHFELAQPIFHEFQAALPVDQSYV